MEWFLASTYLCLSAQTNQGCNFHFCHTAYLMSLLMRQLLGCKWGFDQTICTKQPEKRKPSEPKGKRYQASAGKYPIQRKKMVAIYCSNHKMQ